MLISASVGKDGANRPDDVRAIQTLLNDAHLLAGLPPIAVDGAAGPQTVAAITAFQQRAAGVVDGRVDPDGSSLRRLGASMADGLLDQESGVNDLAARVDAAAAANIAAVPASALFAAQAAAVRAMFTELAPLLPGLRDATGSPTDLAKAVGLSAALQRMIEGLVPPLREVPLNQGQADGRTIEEACERARADCFTTCPGESKPDGRCTCWKGGTLVWTCLATCRCVAPPLPPNS